MVDDGSTDGRGAICDEYAERDERIRVLHTENKGLSCARNLGLDEAQGEWIGFVDSDDWNEPDMYEKKAIGRACSGIDAIEAMIAEEIQTQVWNKICRETLFCHVRFPNGHDFEDISITYKLIQNVTISGEEYIAYHYRQRSSSISQNHSIKNLVDNWSVQKQRFQDLKDIVGKETIDRLLVFCAYSITRTWALYSKSEKNTDYISEMTSFTRSHYHAFGCKEWPIQLRINIFFSRFNNRFSFLIAYYSNQLYRSIKPKYYA